MAEQMDKLRALRHALDESGRSILLEVDGGVDPETAPVCIENGADVLVAGSAVFHAPDRREAIRRLRGSC
jgi:ribulose-phosphate 3-epimerase